MKLLNHILANYYGLKEREGSDFSPTLLRWIKVYFPEQKDDGVIPYCSLALKECAKDIGLNYSTVNPAAISWLSLPNKIDLEYAEMGDVVIISRTGGNHVGLLVRHSKVFNSIYLLGFNQSNECNIQKYSVKLIKGIRRLNED